MSALFKRDDYADDEDFAYECQRFSWLKADTTFHEIARFWSKVYGQEIALADDDGDETLAEYAKRTGQSLNGAARYAADDLLWDPNPWWADADDSHPPAPVAESDTAAGR